MRHTIPFDTHAYIKKLVAAGVPQRQAEVQAETLVEFAIGVLATKDDLGAAKTELKAEITVLRNDLAAPRNEFKADLAALEARLRQEMKDLELRLTVRTGAMPAAAVAIVVALVKLM